MPRKGDGGASGTASPRPQTPVPPPRPGPPAPSAAPAPSPQPAPGRPAAVPTSFGPVPWSREDILAARDGFLSLYAGRPAVDGGGCMASGGLFAVWFLLRAVRPELVIECGVGAGLTTWCIENALPEAALIGLDPDPGRRRYTSSRAAYAETGFLQADLVPEGEIALALFDDHGDAAAQVRKCAELGIKHLLFDDNYPEMIGNRHLSLAACLHQEDASGRDRFPAQKAFLLEHAEAYFVFPPMFDHDAPVTQEQSLILEPSLAGRFREGRDEPYRAFLDDMAGYRWPTYLRLR